MDDEGSFREFEHTADLGIEVQAHSLSGLFATAGLALFSVMLDISSVDGPCERRLEVRAEGTTELLHTWLQRLLVLFMVDGFVARKISVEAIDESGLKATLEGEIFDPAKHEFKTEIKGVTFHELEVKQEGAAWLARIILDV